MCRLKVLIIMCICLLGTGLKAEVIATDSLNNTVRLQEPARRIVSLAPHLTELAFAVGAGEQLVGVVNYSDYPAAALDIPLVGSYKKINYEALIALKPDLVLVWSSGNGPKIAKRLKELGLTLYINEPKRIKDIAKSLRDIGLLAGHQKQAKLASDDFLTRLDALEFNRKKTPIKVFLQLWHEPIMTINGDHIMSDAITQCGGTNLFADALPLVPSVNIESVVRRNPDVIVATGMTDERPEWLNKWLIWKQMSAVEFDDLRSVDPDLLSRHTPRILLGIEKLCQYFDEARDKRNHAKSKSLTSIF